jgi:hypothetical protein
VRVTRRFVEHESADRRQECDRAAERVASAA